MTTQIIVRVDDVTPRLLSLLADWFTEKHPDVPVSGFAVGTEEWVDSAWELSADLITNFDWELGGHTRNHVRLPEVSDDRIRHEVSMNIEDIEEALERYGVDYCVRSFAYPCGLYDQRTIDVLKDLGIDNGLTFSDGLPYESTISVPDGDGRYRWGVANNGSLDLDAWNAKFTYVYNRDGTYVLCIHPDRWESVLLNFVREQRSASSLPRALWNVISQTVGDGYTPGWQKLDAHLEFIKQHSDTRFTTFDTRSISKD